MQNLQSPRDSPVSPTNILTNVTTKQFHREIVSGFDYLGISLPFSGRNGSFRAVVVVKKLQKDGVTVSIRESVSFVLQGNIFITPQPICVLLSASMYIRC
jgi:hypothetical protein